MPIAIAIKPLLEMILDQVDQSVSLNDKFSFLKNSFLLILIKKTSIMSDHLIEKDQSITNESKIQYKN